LWRSAPTRLKNHRECQTYLTKRLQRFLELNLLSTPPHLALGACNQLIFQYSSHRLHTIPIGRYVSALQAEGVAIEHVPCLPLSLLPNFQAAHEVLFPDVSRPIYQAGDFPVAEQLYATALSLPIFTEWPEDQDLIDQYISAFAKVHHYAHQLIA
jgi:dTDP-4-amino-4,6-dideoxygalactose transaminase